MAPVDKWSPADLASLVYKREVEKKSFGQIAVELGQNEKSCSRRYHQIIALREPPVEPLVVESARPIPLHRQLGIETYVHHQAILFDSNGRLGNDKEKNRFAHWYREPVTLAKVFA